MATDPPKGTAIRLTYDDGPVKGKTFEHRFATDGTVSWREPPGAKTEAQSKAEPSATYEYARITDSVYAVAYLAASGFTLTTVVDTERETIVSFASNEKQLFVQHGRLVAS